MFIWLTAVTTAAAAGTLLLMFGIVEATETDANIGGNGDGIQVRVFTPAGQEEDLSVVTNADLNLLLRCESNQSAVEWVFNHDVLGPTDPPCTLAEWTQRTLHHHIGMIRLKCKAFAYKFSYGCRSTTNHSNHMLVTLDPSQTEGQVRISKQWHEWVKDEDTARKSERPCFRFTVAKTANSNYWTCEGPGELHGAVIFLPCDSAAYCANRQRKMKKEPVCLTVLPNMDLAQLWTNVSWVTSVYTNFQAGIATCRTGHGQFESASVEFFFVGPGRAQPHFSLPEVAMSDMIWFDPPPARAVYYTNEVFETRVVVPEYGFAYFPVLIVSVNGASPPAMATLVKYNTNVNSFVHDISVNFSNYGAGDYEIQCTAGVWNTTEWVTKSLHLEVKHTVPPHFESNHTVVTLEDGQAGARIECDAQGDPAPIVTWPNLETLPGIGKEGRHLSFTGVSNGTSITCVATNRFGETSRKTFTILVTATAAHLRRDVPPANATPIIMGVVGVTVALLVVFLCLKYVKSGTTVVQPLLGGVSEEEGRSDQMMERMEEHSEAEEPDEEESPSDAMVQPPLAEGLSDQDVSEFFHGRQSPAASSYFPRLDRTLLQPTRADSEEPEEVAIDRLPYNMDFEVPPETFCNFSIDLAQQLGSGKYGVVYSGHIKLRGDEGEPRAVAIKTVLPNVPKDCFKALLLELKILAFIGDHQNQNVVKLIAAYSRDIMKGVLYMAMELCKTNLLEHLQSHSMNLTISGNQACQVQETCLSINPQDLRPSDLVRWAREIASGMEFLVEKRVVHADLAARNVLLSHNLRAKICDFGLARELVKYTYVRKESAKGYLPWQWMSIEALREMKFSAMSDVWAYGVTCWEIFSMGAVPYPGTVWSWNFVDQLEAGERLGKPRYADQVIFDVISRCWLKDKHERPTFGQLVQFFRDLENQDQGISEYNNDQLV